MSEEFLKIIAIIVIVASLSVTLRNHRPEHSFLLTVFTVCIITLSLLTKLYPTLNSLRSIFKNSGVSTGYFLTAVKALAISYIASFAADSCRDAGQFALAAKAEFAGKCAVFILTLPLIVNILEIVLEFATL